MIKVRIFTYLRSLFYVMFTNNFFLFAVQINSLKEQVETFTKTETELRKQLNVYVDKFKQVEETLNKSNELFLTFRKEMEQV